jgi:glycosyltransferase involved in cell wall biosynthesis
LNIVLFATAWGPRFGGINSFNADFAKGLGELLQFEGTVYCIVPDASHEQIEDASRSSVRLIEVPSLASEPALVAAHLPIVLEAVRRLIPKIDCWVGHDIITGELACAAAEACGGISALFMHMSAIDYVALKHLVGSKADDKHAAQRRLFRTNSARFAIGPLLQDACRDLVGITARQIVPGFPECGKNISPYDKAVGIAFGRLDQANEPIKQGRLAIAAFGDAVRASYEYGEQGELRASRLYVVGLGRDLLLQTKSNLALASKYANRVINIINLPYDENRQALMDRLCEANMSFVLSWHEGFGLAGWEAIAAEVPLVLSQNSGLFRLVEAHLGGAGVGCLSSLAIEGKIRGKDGEWFSDNDLHRTSKIIREISANIARAKRNARFLKEQLQRVLVCTWRHSAQSFMDEIGGVLSPGAAGIGAGLSGRGGVRGLRVHPPRNAVPDLVELLPGVTQGSSTERFDLVPELRFGPHIAELDGFEVRYSLSEAAIQLHMHGCWIAGVRLGDEPHLYVASQGNNAWRIVGPLEGGSLVRRSLGTDILCSIQIGQPDASVELVVSCRQSFVNYEFLGRSLDINKERVISILLNKSLGMKDGVVSLSSSRISARTGAGNDDGT